MYELRPPALDSLGLVGALEEYAMLLSRRADGAPLTVAIDARAPLDELPAAVEVAAYRIVAEALTNVTRALQRRGRRRRARRTRPRAARVRA